MTEIHQIFDEDALRMPNSWKIFLEIRVYVTPKSRTTIMDFLYLQGPRLVLLLFPLLKGFLCQALVLVQSVLSLSFVSSQAHVQATQLAQTQTKDVIYRKCLE